MGIPTERNRDLIILEQIEQDPDATQASLAAQLGVAIGTINWHLKRLVSKGYVKVRRAERRKLRYIITPEGLALRAHLTFDYIQTSFEVYRLVRQRMSDALREVRSKGYDQVVLVGEGDVADICRLTCLEQGVALSAGNNGVALPRLSIQGLKVYVDLPGQNNGAGVDDVSS